VDEGETTLMFETLFDIRSLVAEIHEALFGGGDDEETLEGDDA
jgi:hypothetical protein